MAPYAVRTLFELSATSTPELRNILTGAFRVPAGELAGLSRMRLIEIICERQDPRQAAASPAAPPLPPDHYLVRVEKKPLPTRAELLRDKAFDSVSIAFDGQPWIDAYRLDSWDVPVKPAYGDTVFFLKHFDRDSSSEDAIRWADANGCRPATVLEAIAFAAAHPDFQRQFPIVALGSFVVSFVSRHFVAVLNGGGGRGLGASGFVFDWPGAYRFLFVRK